MNNLIAARRSPKVRALMSAGRAPRLARTRAARGHAACMRCGQMVCTPFFSGRPPRRPTRAAAVAEHLAAVKLKLPNATVGATQRPQRHVQMSPRAQALGVRTAGRWVRPRAHCRARRCRRHHRCVCWAARQSLGWRLTGSACSSQPSLMATKTRRPSTRRWSSSAGGTPPWVHRGRRQGLTSGGSMVSRTTDEPAEAAVINGSASAAYSFCDRGASGGVPHPMLVLRASVRTLTACPLARGVRDAVGAPARRRRVARMAHHRGAGWCLGARSARAWAWHGRIWSVHGTYMRSQER